MNYQKVYMNHIHSSSLLCQLAQMWRSQLLCDALICTGNVVTKAHRVVLLAACPMLQSMENASIGTELEVRLAADIKQDAVTTFLQYLYEGFMLLTEENVKHVEKVARLLQVDSVIKCCSDFFKCLEKSTGKQHNANYKFDKYDLLEFRHVRATGLQKTYHDRLMKRMSEAPRPSSPTGGKRQRLHPRPSSPPTDFMSQRADDAASMTQSYMTGNPSGAGSVRSGASSQSSRSGSPSVVEIIEDSLELIQREKSGPGQPEPSRLAQQKTSISVASHISNTKDTRVINIADDSGGGRTRVTDSFSDRVQNIPSSPQQSSQPQMPVSPKISFRDTHPPQNIQHPSPTSFIQRTPNQMSFTSQPPPPPLQQAGTLNIAPLSQTFSQDRFQQRPQEQQSSQSRPPPMSTDMFMESVKTSQSFITSTPQQRTHPSYPPISGAKPSFAIGSAAQAGAPPQSPSFQSQSTSQQQESTGMADKGEKREGESSRPPEGHDPGPEGNDDTPDLAIVKIEKVGEDETGGLLLQVDSGQGDAAHRHGQLSMEEEQEYDESDLTGDWSQEDISNEGSFQSSHMDDPTGAMYMGPTSGVPRFWLHDDGKERNEKCKDCHRRFASKSGLYKHRKLFHSNARLIECEICGKRFGFLSYYKAHLFTHTENRPYKCEVCGKKYKHMEAFSRHKCVD
ncbi:zinc finger and BTB domain-containing protein 17-like isoform X9 [Mytilus californianus]|uniref:zinc finger and BTB domain-containing protein 17-like isoform X9 n=1 Tax=Mytilus californianus TaxID=6549 RepID=UPI002245A45A|nr:zinc finger and BTB domain-containing protein 17-like isoform X9 [Mytilus californianus]